MTSLTLKEKTLSQAVTLLTGVSESDYRFNYSNYGELLMSEYELDEYVHPGPRFTKDGMLIGKGQGVSMRDYFAAHALPRAQKTHPADRAGRSIADIAYGIADDMMRVRHGMRDQAEFAELNALKEAAHAVDPMNDRVAWTRYHSKLQAMYERGVLS